MGEWVNTTFLDAEVEPIALGLSALQEQEGFRPVEAAEVPAGAFDIGVWPRVPAVGVAIIGTPSWTIVKTRPLNFLAGYFGRLLNPRLALLAGGLVCRGVHMVLEDSCAFYLLEARPGRFAASGSLNADPDVEWGIQKAIRMVRDEDESYDSRWSAEWRQVHFTEELLPLNELQFHLGGVGCVEWVARRMTTIDASYFDDPPWGNAIPFANLETGEPLDLPNSRTAYFLRK